MGFKLAGVMLILMLAMGGIVYWYYNDTQEKLAILHENNAKLETATKVQRQNFHVNNYWKSRSSRKITFIKVNHCAKLIENHALTILRF